ncbi:MAG: chemotaxis protein CheD [Pseudomonadota bacterium]
MTHDRFLRPGEYFFGRCEGSVITLLGSCVAVTLWHPRHHLLAVSHFVLPQDPAGTGLDTRYANGVFQRLLADIQDHGAPAHEYHKGLFGGGRLVRGDNGPMGRVGLNNIDCALAHFQNLGWPINQQDLDGAAYRRLQADGRTGRISCQRSASLGHPPGRSHDQSLYRR